MERGWRRVSALVSLVEPVAYPLSYRPPAGHRSRELERYEHLSPVLKRQTVESHRQRDH
jgi:hypothetical protein